LIDDREPGPAPPPRDRRRQPAFAPQAGDLLLCPRQPRRERESRHAEGEHGKREASVLKPNDLEIGRLEALGAWLR
jgi:hypothetical protein